jgi:hypothetical protein
VQVSGHIIRSRYIYVRQRGEEAYQHVLAQVQPETRTLMESGPLETVWYPFEIYLDLSVTIDRVLGTGDMQLAYEMGSFSCEHNLTGIYRMFFRFGNLNFLLDRAAKAWHSQYDFGTMTLSRDPDNKQRVTLQLADVPRPHRAIFLAVHGWAVKAAELSGSEIINFEGEFSEEPGAPMRWSFEYL